MHHALVDSSGLEVLMNEPGVVSKMFNGTLLLLGTPSFFLIILPSLVFPYFESRVESSHDTFSRLPGVSSLVSAVWCQKSGVNSLVSAVWCQKSGVNSLVSAVWCQRSGVSSLASAICCYLRRRNLCAIFTVAGYVELNHPPNTCSTTPTIEAS